MKKQYAIKDPKESATKRQLWFLHILTGENTREWKLTKGEAAKKIADLKKNGKARPTPAPAKTPTKTDQRKSAPTPKTTPKASEKPKAARKQGRARKGPARPSKGQETATDKVEEIAPVVLPDHPLADKLKSMGAVVI